MADDAQVLSAVNEGTFETISSQRWPRGYFSDPGPSSNTTFGLASALSISQYPDNLFGRPGSDHATKLSRMDGSGRAYIFSDTCVVGTGNGDSDLSFCFNQCNDTAEMFSSLPKLHNCVTAMIAQDAAESENFVYVVTGVGGEPSMTIDLSWNTTTSRIANDLKQCFVDGCTQVPGCAANMTFTSRLSYPENNNTQLALRRYGASLVEEGLCSHISSRVDSDIGGIGVYLSYWVQSSMILLALMGVLVGKYLLPRIHLLSKLGFEWPRLVDGRDIARRRLSRLIVSLTDFHKAQCFFLLATNVAAIVAVNRGGLHPDNLQQIYNNYIFFKIVAISGSLPASFTLFILHIAHMASWYLISLTCVSVFLSLATLKTLGVFSVTQDDHEALVQLAQKDGPASCGFNRPWIFCQQGINDVQVSGDDSMINLDRQAYSIFGFCLFAVLVVILSKLQSAKWPKRLPKRLHLPAQKLRAFIECVTKRKKGLSAKSTNDENTESQPFGRLFLGPLGDIHEHLHNRAPSIGAPLQSAKPSYSETLLPSLANKMHTRAESYGYWRLARQILKVAVTAAVLTIYITFTATFMRYLIWFSANNVYNNEWNFGQIVAISVWVPSIAEWLHLEIRGMRKGMDYKLLPPYHVTKGQLDPGTKDVDDEEKIVFTQDPRLHALLNEKPEDHITTGAKGQQDQSIVTLKEEPTRSAEACAQNETTDTANVTVIRDFAVAPRSTHHQEDRRNCVTPSSERPAFRDCAHVQQSTDEDLPLAIVMSQKRVERQN